MTKLFYQMLALFLIFGAVVAYTTMYVSKTEKPVDAKHQLLVCLNHADQVIYQHEVEHAYFRSYGTAVFTEVPSGLEREISGALCILTAGKQSQWEAASREIPAEEPTDGDGQ